MATTGYILNTATQEILEKMNSLGCCRIYIEDKLDECSRPKRRIMMKMLRPGDTLVIPGLCHLVRNCTSLSALLQICQSSSIRIVSLGDRVDTGGIMYKDESDRNLITVFRQLPYDIVILKQSIGETRIHTPKCLHDSKTERDEAVINMYISGLSTEDIQKVATISKRTMYRILKRNNIACDRARPKRVTKK